MAAEIRLKTNDTVVFIGDSITDADRHRRAYEPLGFGYVHFTGHMLLARYPHLDLKLINRGISGNTIADMAARWQQDCLAHQPDLLSALIGINDVWRSVMEPDRATSTPEQYEITYDRLLLEARQRCHCQVVILEPFLFNDDPQAPVRQALEPYLARVRWLAERHGATLVPLQQKLDEQMTQVSPPRWSSDMVHPELWAHAWIAQQWLAATGL